MHTSPAFAEDVYIGANCGVDIEGHRATFVVAVNSPGVTVLCRKMAARDPDPFAAPLSNRFDELDGQMWLDDVFIPWERVFLTEPSPEPVARWLFWHQLYCWLSKAEFTLGLALASTHAMGLASHDPTIEYLIDLVTDVQTVRELPARHRARSRGDAGGLVCAQPRAFVGRQPGDAAGAAAHGGDLAHPARLLAGGGAVRSRAR